MCGETARTGLWGSRWETAGSTRIWSQADYPIEDMGTDTVLGPTRCRWADQAGWIMGPGQAFIWEIEQILKLRMYPGKRLGNEFTAFWIPDC